MSDELIEQMRSMWKRLCDAGEHATWAVDMKQVNGKATMRVSLTVTDWEWFADEKAITPQPSPTDPPHPTPSSSS